MARLPGAIKAAQRVPPSVNLNSSGSAIAIGTKVTPQAWMQSAPSIPASVMDARA
jgi:hypothetical protein